MVKVVMMCNFSFCEFDIMKKNIKIAFLFGIFPKEYYGEILANSKYGIQHAADALQKSFIEGVGSLTKDAEIINVPYIGSYPQRYSCLYSPGGTFCYKTENNHVIQGTSLRFCNLKGYKMYDSSRVAKNALLDWVKKNEFEDKLVMVYAVYVPFLKAVEQVKKKCPTLKVLLIVPDLPEYMGNKTSFFRKCLNPIYHVVLEHLYEVVDYYVLLSKYMVERLPVANKPWIVIEGIFNKGKDDEQIIKTKSDTKTIFYAGTLAERYGILDLVHAFTKIQNPSFRLVICGDGDTKDEIVREAQLDNRIIYKGSLPRNEVILLQRQADLLVNPRTPEGEFTKYSFPSKTMEYLASGVPTLLYRLPGIPDEYFDYCFVIEKLGVDVLKDKMEEILAMPLENLKNVGNKARNFVLEQKNPIQQCKKIFYLIQNNL